MTRHAGRDPRPEVAVLERRLNAEIGRGRLLRAYTPYYHAGSAPSDPGPGGGPVSQRVIRFFEWAETFVGASLLGCFVLGPVSRSEWLGAGPEGSGKVVHVVTRRWRRGCVDREAVRVAAIPGPVAPRRG